MNNYTCGLCGHLLFHAEGYTHLLSERVVRAGGVREFPDDFCDKVIGERVHSRCLIESGCADMWRQREWQHLQDRDSPRNLLSADLMITCVDHLGNYWVYRRGGRISVMYFDFEKGRMEEDGFHVLRGNIINQDLTAHPMLLQKIRSDLLHQGSSDLRPVLDELYEHSSGKLYPGLSGKITAFEDGPEETFDELENGFLTAGCDFDLVLTRAEYEAVSADRENKQC